MERGACAPLKILCCRRGAFYMRPCSLRQVPQADMESAPTFCFGPSEPKLHIFYYLLSFIYYLLIFPFCKAIFEKRAADFTISNPFVHLILWSYQTVRLLRPFARRRAMTLRPFLVAMRFRKPWTRLRWRFLGWKVRFIFHSSCWNSQYGAIVRLLPYTGAALQT